MTFVDRFNALPLQRLRRLAETASQSQIKGILDQQQPSLEDFARLLSPAADECLETLCRRSQALTRQRFGKVIRLFAPLYLSNECINNCQYCGFSRDNPILRVTLSPDEVAREADALHQQGFRNLLLVAGEHPKFVSNGYVGEIVARLHRQFPSISLELGPLETGTYRGLVAAGADGLVVYQETYDRQVYALVHTAGPKKNFDWRMETPERAYDAGFRRLGIGALFGLSEWRCEAIALAAHAQYLLRHCWRAQLTISLPRLRPCAGSYDPPHPLADRHLLQILCALRLFLPDVGLVLSTREPEPLRNGLIPVGVTLMSAGSHTEPGGYTGAGRNRTHYTEKGRIRELAVQSSEWVEDQSTNATAQFDIADARSAQEVAAQIRQLGYEPVWKDWDMALNEAAI